MFTRNQQGEGLLYYINQFTYIIDTHLIDKFQSKNQLNNDKSEVQNYNVLEKRNWQK